MKTFTEAAPTTTATRQNPAMRVQTRIEHDPHHRRLAFRLNCGRQVLVEEIRITPSTLGYLAGSKDAIRADLMRHLPDRVMDQFHGHGGFLIKPIPEGELPAYTFMVALVCQQPVSDPAADFSSLVVCWLGDDIETSLPEMIDREIRAIGVGQARGGWQYLRARGRGSDRAEFASLLVVLLGYPPRSPDGHQTGFLQNSVRSVTASTEPFPESKLSTRLDAGERVVRRGRYGSAARCLPPHGQGWRAAQRVRWAKAKRA